jgi:hypothetical protein
MEVSVKKLMEVSWGSGKNRDTIIPPRFIEKLPKIKPHLDALLENGIYIRQELIDAVLNDAGEK